MVIIDGKQMDGDYIKLGGKRYKVLAFFNKKREAKEYADRQRSRGYYRSIRITPITGSTHKYWVCGRRQ